MVSMNIGLHLLDIMLFLDISIMDYLSIITLVVLQMEVGSSNAQNPLNTLTVPLSIRMFFMFPFTSAPQLLEFHSFRLLLAPVSEWWRCSVSRSSLL